MIELTATEILGHLQQGSISAQEVVEGFLNQLEIQDPSLGSFLHYDPDQARTRARQIDLCRQSGQPLGLMAGLPIALKDNICLQGSPTTCASKILQGYRSPFDAHVVSRLKEAGAVILGKTNLDEFAMGSTGELSAYKPCRNPWNLGHVPGGSSAGSGAAVAASLVPLALGSDTGGSIRLPASFCGIVGLKPTYGRVSRYGLVAYASSLDQIGPFGRSAADVALVLQAIAGHDDRDSTSTPRPVPPYFDNLEKSPLPGKIGIVREHFAEGLDPEVHRAMEEALKIFRSLGLETVEVSCPLSPYSIATYYLIATAEASSNLARYDGVHFGHRAANARDLLDLVTRSRGEGFGAEVKRRILLGTFALSAGYKEAYYLKALKVRRLIQEEYQRAFAQCGVIVSPTSPCPAFPLGQVSQDPMSLYLADIYTIGANLAGLPAISIPAGFTRNKLPIGLQILAPAFAEEQLLALAQAFQKATDWHQRRPG